MKALLDFIVDILKVPSVLVGIIALIGLIAQKKPVADIIKGTIKTILGFIVLGGGAGVLLGSLNPLGDIFQQAFNVQGVVPNNEAIVSTALEKYGTATALIMAFGMVANIAIARFTRLKFIFLTGHHTFYMACMIAVILVVAGFEGVQLVLVGALTLGLIMAFFPFIAQPFMRDITGSDEVGFGHFGTVGYVLAGLVGRSLRGKSRSTEEMNLPKNLGFLRDSSVSIALTMMVIYLVLVIAAGAESVQVQFSKGQNYLVWAVIQAITFAAGVFIILQGVRLILAEIVPAFTGFSQKLVPNARPALDCPIVFPYAPNAVLVGFLASSIISILQYFSDEETLKTYLLWSFGSVAGTTWRQLHLLMPVVALGLGLALLMPKPMNALALGEGYARSVGTNVPRVRFALIAITSLLAGSITAFTGPIAFLGMAVPHFVRTLFRTSDHRILLPATMLSGALLLLVCDLLTQLPGRGLTLPINALTSLIGAPVVIFVVLRSQRGSFSL